MMAKIKQAATVAACSALMFGSTLALAADPVAPTTGGKGVDLTPLTNSVNFNSVLVGIMAVAGSLILLYAGSAGVKWILRMVKSA